MLALFVDKYLQINQFELAGHKQKNQEELEEFILCRDIIQSDDSINCQIDMYFRTAK